MTQSIHEDFIPSQKNPNTCWCWVQNDNGEYVWAQSVINNAIAGDTDSIMISMKDILPEGFDDIDLAVEIADAVGELTNESFADFCKHAFNCPEDRKTIMGAAREVVSDKSLFVSKKRYAMHVVDNEGKRVDKMKIMGLEIKKSDTSAVLKDMLLGLIHFILDGYGVDQINEEIRKMKEAFFKLDAHSISKPINVKTLKKCNDMYEMTGDMKGFPYQVRAAMFWNLKAGDHDKKIVPGDKVRLLYIKNKESKYIAFPVDTMTFPQWFTDDIIIDYNTEWEKAYAKIENYLKSVGMDIASRKEAIRNDLFGF